MAKLEYLASTGTGRRAPSERRSSCPFCHPDSNHVFHKGTNVLGLWDSFPVSPGTRFSYRNGTSQRGSMPRWTERSELLSAIDIARDEILSRHQPDGFNIGINIGEAAGQTIPHLHIHVIPRYRGDVDDPTGGVRHVIPAKANYLAGQQSRC